MDVGILVALGVAVPIAVGVDEGTLLAEGTRVAVAVGSRVGKPTGSQAKLATQ